MYPRAGAYIISVKQSTYCQFGEVIRAHTEREKREGEDCWVKRGSNKSKKDKRQLHRKKIIQYTDFKTSKIKLVEK